MLNVIFGVLSVISVIITIVLCSLLIVRDRRRNNLEMTEDEIEEEIADQDYLELCRRRLEQVEVRFRQKHDPEGLAETNWLDQLADAESQATEGQEAQIWAERVFIKGQLYLEVFDRMKEELFLSDSDEAQRMERWMQYQFERHNPHYATACEILLEERCQKLFQLYIVRHQRYYPADFFTHSTEGA